MRRPSYTALLLVFLTSVCTSQHVNEQVPDRLIDGMLDVELSRRIFDNERDMMRRIRIYSPIVETYIQSLWPDTIAQMPLDDVYFLREVDFSRYLISEDYTQTMLFGSSKRSRQVLNDNGQRWGLYPEGFVSMLFVDQQAFDADTYQLKYLKRDTLGTVSCLLFAVTPLRKQEAGRFNGTVWIENVGFRIIRAEGTFQVRHVSLAQRLNVLRGVAPLVLHFDCWREMIAPNLWVPAYVIVDDSLGWKAITGGGTTDVHYRGWTSVWGYSHLGSFQNRRLAFQDPASDLEQEITGLEKDSLVAPSGRIERSLNAIVEEMTAASHLKLPKVTCRVLETIPLEVFHVGNTILVSRGFLEMVPDESTLAVFLAHELAHVALDTATGKQFDYEQSVFQRAGGTEFLGLGIAHDQGQEANASALTCRVLNDSAYVSAIGRATGFVEQLTTMSPQIPNLTKARFGVGLIENGRAVHELPLSCGPNGQSVPHMLPLQLRGRYLVGTSTGELRLVP
jgi:Peptidase family M48